MADSDNKDGATEPRYMTHEDFNKALDNRLGKLYSGLESKIEGYLSRVSKQAVESDDLDTPSSHSDDKQPDIVRMLKEERRARQKLEANLNSEKLHNNLMSSLKGKVSDTWLDLAVDSLKRQSSITKSGQAEITLDNVPYSLSEGIEYWLRQEGNKRFLPSPTNVKNTKHASTPRMKGGVNQVFDRQAKIQEVLSKLDGAHDDDY